MSKLTGNSIVASARNSLKLLSRTRTKNIYPDFSTKNTFSQKELVRCADGLLFGDGNAQLPSSPLLMLDRIVDIQSTGGKFERGYAIAELDIDSSKWFFEHHFHGDPVMPGCFLIEALWQLTGFHLAWSGHKGRGRVLESGRTRFVNLGNNKNQTLIIKVHIRKIMMVDRNPICITNGEIGTLNTKQTVHPYFNVVTAFLRQNPMKLP